MGKRTSAVPTGPLATYAGRTRRDDVVPPLCDRAFHLMIGEVARRWAPQHIT